MSSNCPVDFLWCLGNFIHHPTVDVTLGPSFDIQVSHTHPLFDGDPMCVDDPLDRQVRSPFSE